MKGRNQRNVGIKGTLVGSVVSMLLCVAMLVSTTFAWFTDSAQSGTNQIMSGTLDVELYHSNNAVTNKIVQEDTPLFVNHNAEGAAETILWEPGVIVYENFKVANVGSLALKYKMMLNVVGNNTVQGTQKSLKDVLKVAIVEGGFSGSREDAQALSFDKTLSNFEKEGHLLAGETGNSDTYGIVIYWEPSAVDNEYNLSNGKQSSDGNPLYVDIKIRLIATQDTVEFDSFNNQYDALAWDDLMEEENKSTLEIDLTHISEYVGADWYDTGNSKLISAAVLTISSGGKIPDALTFTVTGHAAEDKHLTFDFAEKCGEGEEYQGIVFDGGFGGYGDVFLTAGQYGSFDLVGTDYYPVIFTVTPGEENQNKFSYRGSLTGLIEKLKEGFTLHAGVEYNDTFVVSVEWPWETPCTDTCYVETNGNRETWMDLADTYIAMYLYENGLWADCEVKIQ